MNCCEPGILYIVLMIVMCVPVTTAWQVLRLRMEERLQ